MARNFDDASSHGLSVASAPLTAYPFTMACWFNSDDATITQILMSICDSASANEEWSLRAAGAVAGDPIRFTSRTGGTNRNADTTVGYSTGAWTHACAVGVSATNRSVYINGGSVGTNVTSSTPTSLDTFSIGVSAISVPFGYMSGDIAEAAIWNVALAAEDVARLALALDPRMVRPQGLVAYWPLIGRYSPEIDRRGGLGLTVSGAVAAVHPRMFHAG